MPGSPPALLTASCRRAAVASQQGGSRAAPNEVLGALRASWLVSREPQAGAPALWTVTALVVKRSQASRSFSQRTLLLISVCSWHMFCSFPIPSPPPPHKPAMPALLHFSGVIFPAPLGLRGRRCPSRSGEGISWADEPEIDPHVSPFSG